MEVVSADEQQAGRDELIARLETALADVRAGRAVGVACVVLDAAGGQEPWWATADYCVHAGAVLRSAVAYLSAAMDHRMLCALAMQQRESDPRLS